MKLKNNLLKLTFTTLLIMTSQISFAQDYTQLITEEYLQNEFAFEMDEKIKYIGCKKINYPTCKYIWGVPSKSDAVKAKYNLAPEGKKVMVIYAKASKPEDFKRSIAVYSDPIQVEGIGINSVWSPVRKQLSLITDKNLIFHVNLETIKDGKAKEHAIHIAKHILEQL